MTYYAQLIDAALRSWPATFRRNEDKHGYTVTFEQRPFAHLYLTIDPFVLKIKLTPEQQQRAAGEGVGQKVMADADPHGEWLEFFVDSDDTAQIALNWLKVAYDEMMRQELAGRVKKS